MGMFYGITWGCIDTEHGDVLYNNMGMFLWFKQIFDWQLIIGFTKRAY